MRLRTNALVWLGISVENHCLFVRHRMRNMCSDVKANRQHQRCILSSYYFAIRNNFEKTKFSRLKTTCDEANIRFQFHQHFTRALFVQKLCVQIFCNYILCLYFFWQKNIGVKPARKMLVKLTEVVFFHLSVNVC